MGVRGELFVEADRSFSVFRLFAGGGGSLASVGFLSMSARALLKPLADGQLLQNRLLPERARTSLITGGVPRLVVCGPSGAWAAWDELVDG